MNELQKVFEYQDRQVRTVVKGGEPWFIASDVCNILGIDTSTTVNGRNRKDDEGNTYRDEGLDDDEKGTVIVSTPGGFQEVLAVTEPGLYSLVLKSRKPEAKEFKRWITHEVLPSIRQHGIYATDKVIDTMLLDPEFGIRLLTELKTERTRRQQLEIENAQSKQIIGELRPKASYYDLILQNKSLVPITKIAKDYGMSGKSMNSLLHDLGIQYRMGDTWLLYQRYADQGFTQSRTHAIDADRSKMWTYWTQKGRLFLYDLLKNRRGILPVIEQREQSA